MLTEADVLKELMEGGGRVLGVFSKEDLRVARGAGGQRIEHGGTPRQDRTVVSGNG